MVDVPSLLVHRHLKINDLHCLRRRQQIGASVLAQQLARLSTR